MLKGCCNGKGQGEIFNVFSNPKSDVTTRFMKATSNLSKAEICCFFDAMQVGYFSSGRNAGFIIDVPHSIVGDPNFTLDDQKWRFRLNRYVIDRMVMIKEENNLQID